MVEQSKAWAYQRDPFRLFFPLGIIYGVWAVGVWILFSQGIMVSYPGSLHTSLMFAGFELSFVVGFLMTALPRFTSTAFASKPELVIAATLVLLPGLLAAGGASAWIPGSTTATLVFLVVYGYRRFGHRKVNPPDSFLFVGAGLLLGLLAQVIRVVGQFGFLSEASAVEVSRMLFHHGFIMGLVLGIGGRLIPGLLGWSEIVSAQRSRYEQPLPFVRVISPLVLALLVLFIASFALEVSNIMAGRTLRASVVLAMGLSRWRLNKRPVNTTKFAWGIWAASWCLVAGEFCYALLPSLALESEHISFIGGYSLLTLLVASRVTLAHGKAGSLDFEKRPWVYVFIVGLIVMSMLTRFFASAVPASYVHHLGYAAAIWIVGVVVWAIVFVPKIFRP